MCVCITLSSWQSARALVSRLYNSFSFIWVGDAGSFKGRSRRDFAEGEGTYELLLVLLETVGN